MDTVERINIVLTITDKELMRKYIVKSLNVVKACKYANIHYSGFKKALKKNGTLRPEQRRLLIEYCEKVKTATGL